MPKFISEKAASKATPSKVIKYVMNPEKCCKDENGELVMSTIGLDNDRPYSQQFREIAELAGNDYTKSDRKYYHFKISCAPDDYSPDGEQKITPEQFKREVEDFVYKNFPGYQAVITIQYHGEQNPFLHAHIVLNASSYEPDQNKIDLRNRDLDSFRDQAFEMGKPYGLEGNYWRDEVAEKRELQRQNQTEPEAINISDGEKEIIAKHGKNFSDHSWKEQYRIAIREAVGATTNLDTFCGYLKEHFHIDTQITKQGNIKYKFPERTTYSSGKALGYDYELEAVEKALEETKNKPSELPKEPSESERQAFEKAFEWHQKFNEEYVKFQKWQEEDYRIQRGEWLKKERDADAEYHRDKTIIENTNALYKLCQEIMNNETLSAMMSEKQRTEMAELDRSRERLLWKENENDWRGGVTQNEQTFWDFRNEMHKKYREDLNDVYNKRRDVRDTYYDALRVVRNSDSVLLKIAALGVTLYSIKKEQKINRQIQDLKEQRNTFIENTANYETFQKAYSSELQAGKLPGSNYMDNLANTYKVFDREQRRQHYVDTLNTTGTSLADRIRAAQGLRDMNVEEGKKSRENELYNYKSKKSRSNVIYAKRDWALQRQMDAIRVARELGAETRSELELKVKQEGREYGKIKREYTVAKKQYDEAVNAASAAISQDTSLSVEERIKKLEEVKSAEYEKIRELSEKFHEAKDHYKDCARALETLETLQNKQYLYNSSEQVQEEKQEEAPRRTKEEAEKARKKQWAELRDWSDEATQTVASQPFTSKEADLRQWAKSMESHGAIVRITANTISLKHPNSNQAVRTNRLGGAYEREEILNDISIQRKAERGDDQGSKGSRNERTTQGNSRAQNIAPGRSPERIRERNR